MWKSSEGNYLQIHPIDPLYSYDNYYIGVYGVGKDKNDFEISFVMEEPVPIYELEESKTVLLSEIQNFVYTAIKGEEYIIQQVCVNCCADKVLLCGAWDYILPTKNRNQVCNKELNKKELEEYDPFVIDTNNNIKYLVDYIMPKINTSESKTSFKLNRYSWKGANTLYISVENLTSTPISITLQVKGTSTLTIEWKLNEIVPEEVYKKYKLLNKVFEGVEGGVISHEERSQKALQSPEFTYGEIDFIQFFPLLNYYKGNIFWDLGCGTGKSLITAAMCGFKEIYGVEFLYGLCRCANKAIGKYMVEVNENRKDLFKVIEGDITKVDWSNADVLFASSLCFPDQLMKTISEMGTKLKKGTIIMSIKKFEGEQYKILRALNVKMGWGKKPLYIMQRI